MVKPDTRALLVELPSSLAARLDAYCARKHLVKAGFVRRAIETLLDDEAGSTKRFVLDLTDEQADDLESYRVSREDSTRTGVVTFALREYIQGMLKSEPVTRARFEEHKRRLNEERRRERVTAFNGGKSR